MKYDVIIIGGGMSGLAAGIRLAYYQKKVCILEQHSALGGLNSHYVKDGYNFDVGLHAMTNFSTKENRKSPLNKLLRQLRISYDQLDLVEQNYSEIKNNNYTLKFNNNIELLFEEINNNFPDQIDKFKDLVEYIKTYDDVNLNTEYISCKEHLKSFLSNQELIDLILCPIFYYGSAQENDIDFSQFCIMFKSLFLEGFCRPQLGVRQLLRLLKNKFKENGGVLKYKKRVKNILHKENKAYGVELDDETILESNIIISSAGLKETQNLVQENTWQNQYSEGKLSFVESILLLDKHPRDLGINQSIIFFNYNEEFCYQEAKNAVDFRSGVICIPNNFNFTTEKLKDNCIRFTNLANYHIWKNFSPEEYLRQKEDFVMQQLKQSSYYEVLKNHITYIDSFTPTTVHKFTSHINGAIYGSPDKIKNGLTPINGLFLCGTDQGFLGIVGALLSGISIANLHALK